jgi:GNAT superfamily N-acetyltransferase
MARLLAVLDRRASPAACQLDIDPLRQGRAMTSLQAIVRPAWSADLGNLARIDPSLPGSERGRTASRLLGQGRSWVAEVNGAPVGYALTSLEFFSRPLVEMLVVAEAYRRRGVGLKLLEHCEAAHRDDRLFVTTNASNAPAQRLLAKAGFQGSGVIYNLDAADPQLVFVKLRTPPLTFFKYRSSA